MKNLESGLFLFCATMLTTLYPMVSAKAINSSILPLFFGFIVTTTAFSILY